MSVATNFGAIKLSYKKPGTEDTVEESIVCNYGPSIELVESFDNINNENVSPSTNITCIQGSPAKNGIFKCTECSFTCPATSDLAQHYVIHRVKDPFKCFKCGYVGSSKDDFMEHSMSHIESNYYKCSKCIFKTINLKTIQSHVLKHDNQVYSCTNCTKKFQTIDGRREHAIICQGKREAEDSEDVDNDVISLLKMESANINGSHMKVPRTCPTCYFIFNSRSGLVHHTYQTHLKNWKVKKSQKRFKRNVVDEQPHHHNPYVLLDRMYLCGYCYFIFETEDDLNTHNLTHKINTTCHICNVQFLSNADLRAHRSSTHPFEPQLPCEYCDEFSSNAMDMINHLKLKHNIKSAYPCPHCPRMLKTEQGLKQHLECHSRMKSFDCQECGYMALNPSDLRKHLRKHLPAVLECPNMCGKLFKSERSRRIHMESCGATNEEVSDDSDEESDESDHVPFVDDLNDEDFHLDGEIGLVPSDTMNVQSSSAAPLIEIDISQKEKLICSDCKQSFENSEDLKIHLLTHYETSPFRCQTCGERCSSLTILNAHKKIHGSNASPYSCPVCLKICFSSSRLKRHLATHTTERPYECTICGSCYKTKDTLQKHARAVHSSQVYKCTKCDYETGRKDGFKKHMASHARID